MVRSSSIVSWHVQSPVDWAQKATPNWPWKHLNLPTVSWVMVRSSSIVSWCVQWHHKWTRLKKLPHKCTGLEEIPQIDFSRTIESAYWFLSYGKVVFHCQLMCTVPSQVVWAWKTTPNSPLKHQNLPIGSWVIVRLSSIVSWCVQCHHKCTGLKKLPQIDPWSIRICLLVPELW